MLKAIAKYNVPEPYHRVRGRCRTAENVHHSQLPSGWCSILFHVRTARKVLVLEHCLMVGWPGNWRAFPPEADKSFMGDHLLVRPVATEEFHAVTSKIITHLTKLSLTPPACTVVNCPIPPHTHTTSPRRITNFEPTPLSEHVEIILGVVIPNLKKGDKEDPCLSLASRSEESSDKFHFWAMYLEGKIRIEFRDHVEIEPHGQKIFDELFMEQEVLGKAVASWNTVRCKETANINIIDVEEEELVE
ncbi:hypothetical protein B0H16DRAFT_1467322 [Mycena metata]|uniref:Uncharacterized protein n=1 Tax=Mycena metata TaxID=1033252 RepID=A0AAD7MVN6_9AGAR|nr:hypothetical protein B0H16DRAFT_1467322 [Mycena metata]